MGASFKIDVDSFSRSLESEKEAFHNAARPGAQAGADVVYQLARARVPVSDGAHFFYGTSYRKTGQRYLFSAGTLRDSIYQVFSKDNSGVGVATYHVSWNHQKAPYGFMVEYGTSRAPAHPFLGPAIHDGEAAAAQAMETAFLGALQ